MSTRDEQGSFVPAEQDIAEAQEFGQSAEETSDANPLEDAELWRIDVPQRGEFPARSYAIYVQDDLVVGTLGGASWALWQPWNTNVKPWFAKRGARGQRMAKGERLEL